jgi:hypothetical protein
MKKKTKRRKKLILKTFDAKLDHYKYELMDWIYLILRFAVV